jgi:hypothetical protein
MVRLCFAEELWIKIESELYIVYSAYADDQSDII